MNDNRPPLWRRKSVWGVAVAAVAAGGVIVGGLTIEDAGAIIHAVTTIVGGFF